ncbi:unnamed protein product [Urochloa humidicola]
MSEYLSAWSAECYRPPVQAFRFSKCQIVWSTLKFRMLIMYVVSSDTGWHTVKQYTSNVSLDLESFRNLY